MMYSMNIQLDPIPADLEIVVEIADDGAPVVAIVVDVGS